MQSLNKLPAMSLVLHDDTAYLARIFIQSRDKLMVYNNVKNGMSEQLKWLIWDFTYLGQTKLTDEAIIESCII